MKPILHLILVVLFPASIALAQTATPSAPVAATPGVFHAAEAAKLLPESVFFKGQKAPAQVRNSGGVRFSSSAVMLVTLVDNSGYSSQVQEKYQAYLITETPLDLDGHTLPPGAYGAGFLAGDTFVVMDIGGHDLLTAHTAKDAGLRRPAPLQVLAAPGSSDHYRIYSGRTYVEFTAAH
ncbi:MAG: hypothetical protein KGK08_11670 [Acidobacteriota bacterium]|nr:hypothetical protein [Acidobacteriota bacterium]